MDKKAKTSNFINRLGCGSEILYCTRVYVNARLYGGAWIWMEWCINTVFFIIKGHTNHVRRAYLWERRYYETQAKTSKVGAETPERETPGN